MYEQSIDRRVTWPNFIVGDRLRVGINFIIIIIIRRYTKLRMSRYNNN